jgi:hypothetical protein
MQELVAHTVIAAARFSDYRCPRIALLRRKEEHEREDLRKPEN